MSIFLQHLRHSLRSATAAGLAGLCLIVGIAFLTVAFWLVLASAKGTIFAAVVMGGLYSGVGLISLAAQAGDRDDTSQRATQTLHGRDSDIVLIISLAEAFLQGLNGAKTSKAPDHDQ